MSEGYDLTENWPDILGQKIKSLTMDILSYQCKAYFLIKVNLIFRVTDAVLLSALKGLENTDWKHS